MNQIFEGYFNLEPLELFQKTSNDFKSNFLSHYEVKMIVEVKKIKVVLLKVQFLAWINVPKKEKDN